MQVWFSMLLASMFLCMSHICNDLPESVADKFVANLMWPQLQAQQASINIKQSGVLGHFWTSTLIKGNAMCLPMKTSRNMDILWPTYFMANIFGPLCFLYRALWYNYVMQTNKMHTSQITVLILFLVSSTCFKHHVFIIRKTICTCRWYVFHAFMCNTKHIFPPIC